MSLDTIADFLIYIHAGLGFIALISGAVALATRKGSPVHKKSGKAFYLAMLGSAGMALVISAMPSHQSSFLFVVGLFSLYLIITGYLAVGYKRSTENLKLDKVISWLMAFVGAGMVLFPLALNGQFNIVLSVFGLIGAVLSGGDLKLYRDPKSLKRNWMRQHLSKMIGGYIAATTAFVVVNDILPGIYGWLAPTAVGTLYIGYWLRKTKVKAI